MSMENVIDIRHLRKSFGAQYRVHPAGRGDGDVTGSHDLSRRGEKVSR